jgi:hypothetical protein
MQARVPKANPEAMYRRGCQIALFATQLQTPQTTQHSTGQFLTTQLPTQLDFRKELRQAHFAVLAIMEALQQAKSQLI